MAGISGFSPLARVAAALSLLLCGASEPALAQRIAPNSVAPGAMVAAAPVDPARLFGDALARLHSPATFIVGDPSDGQAFSYRNADTVVVDRHIVASIATPDEALALAALLHTYAIDNPPALRTKDGVSATAIGAGLLLGVAGSQLDKETPRDRYFAAADQRARGDRHAPDWTPRKPEARDVQQVLATRTLTLLDKAGGCSGALATILERIANGTAGGQATGAGIFARFVLRDLGGFIQPPDTSCYARR